MLITRQHKERFELSSLKNDHLKLKNLIDIDPSHIFNSDESLFFLIQIEIVFLLEKDQKWYIKL